MGILEYVEAKQVNQTIQTQRKSVVLRGGCLILRDGFSYPPKIQWVADLPSMDREIKEGVEDSFHGPKAYWGGCRAGHPSRQVLLAQVNSG